MRHYARPLRATLTTLVMLLAMAGAAGAEDTTRLIGDFYHADCPLDDCPRPPSSPGLGSAAGMPESADKAKTLTRHTQSVAPESAARRFSIEISSCALTRRTCSQ
jgi:hypothetical protein